MSGPDVPVTVHCSNCGGQTIRADAFAAWDAELQMWELAALFDQRFCDDCGHSVTTYEQALIEEGEPAEGAP